MAAEPVTNTPLFDCPTWAGKPTPGLHLDVVKGDKLVEKLIIDEKKFYLFGRNPDACDFTIDHQSCSRVHAALIYHRHLKRVFLIDLNSTHGTFLGRIRLEPHKPQQVPIDSTMSFGASTRAHSTRAHTLNLTEFNTAHNKRISTLTIEEGNLDIQRPKRKRRSSRVSFSDDEEIINPEDIDPSVGRFRNMIQTAVVPMKKKKAEVHGTVGLVDAVTQRTQVFPFSGGLYGDLPPTSHEAAAHPAAAQGGATILGALPVPFPNPAPEVDLTPTTTQPPVTLNPTPTPRPYAPRPRTNPARRSTPRRRGRAKSPPPPC
ncbi:hypothetical protein AAFF_G00174840 [Aldrovandia affinis]|uniref:Nuclear inhibitor of protein phosphatase 1 n=1 Tax=Aldrovandia affinis TaxID=143900 RepID=A0AAD7RL41_9TELE|nr:hypothetical protein AAFF_G00174840 [Aldrovandia affinis]